MDNRQSYKHISWALADQIMVSGVNFMTGILFARYFGQDEYGRFSLVWMSVLFFSSIQITGIIAPMMSHAPKLTDEAKPNYYGAVIVQQLILSILSCILLWFCIVLSSYIFPQWNIQMLKWPLVCVILSWQLQDFLRRYFFVTNKGYLAFINDSISYLGQLGLLVTLLYCRTFGLIEVLWLIALTSTIAVFIGMFSVRSVSFSFNSLCSVTKQHWYDGKWLIASSLIQWSTGNLFIIALGAVVNQGAVGAIRAALNVMGVMHIIFLGLENIIPASAAKLIDIEGIMYLKKYIFRSIFLCLGVTSLFSAVISVNPEWIFYIFFGENYKGYGYILWWYVPIYLLTSIGVPLRAGLRAMNNVQPIFIANLLAAIFTLSSSKYLVKNYEISGAMVGILATQIIIQGYVLFVFIFNKHKAVLK